MAAPGARRPPPELETIRKILELERSKGFADQAVSGGLATFAERWQGRIAQGGRPELAGLRGLAGAVASALAGYGTLPPAERAVRVETALGLLNGEQTTRPTASARHPQPTRDAPRSRPAGDAPHPPPPAPARGRGGAITHVPDDAPDLGVRDDAGRSPPLRVGEGGRVGDVIPEGRAGEGHSHPPPPRTRSAQPAVAATADTPLAEVKGVKEKEAKLFAKLGLHAFGDLLRHYPTRYQPYPPATLAADLLMQPIASFVGVVQQVDIAPSPRGGLHKIVATIGDQTGRVSATWFRHGRFSPVQAGQRVAISGKLTQFGRALNFENPDWERVGQDGGEPVHTRRMVPTYPLTAGLQDRTVRERIKWAVDALADTAPDPLPGWLRETYDLWPLGAALRQVHFPDDPERLRIARRRLAFDELFAIQLVVVQRKVEWQGVAAPSLNVPQPALDALLGAQPFRLTGGQRSSLQEILVDTARPQPMTRLLQGEVGSGKTAVAAAALFVAVQNGAQGSLMAPTEILSEQHYRSISTFYERAAEALERAGARMPRVGLLTGSTRTAERRRIYQAIADGEIDILVGTQAVIQENVELANLALAVVDEQHRFGVRQRIALREKGGHPHLLVMTATPIPRTLALSIYGDLDLSTIGELPPGRQKIDTHLLDPDERPLAYEKIRREVAKGGQAFVICPLVEDSPNLEARAATAEYERLQAGELAGLRLGLLHGRMRPADKDRVMREFRDHEFDVLVSTAVVEVGVDIPNASVMLIEGAERFGLAQLHQFRGRVGRGQRQSVCLLLTEEASEATLNRLQVLVDSDSGLALAEHDLKLRGPGDYFGVRQSGFPELQVATLDDVGLVERARKAAEKVLEHDPTLELPRHAGLAALVVQFRRRAGEPN
ncbi:MAG: ATP-dependent DNA helicase RecG [Chloroflexi bacterium]|nr:ATP-dependent DNA helicase RecG [Chloroflexota bacterium]